MKYKLYKIIMYGTDREKLKLFKEIMFDNRIYFSTNSVGDLFSDYKKEIRDV